MTLESPTHLEVTAGIRIPIDELKITHSRSGGPGGQNVNKVNTKVTIHWPVTESPNLPEDVRTRFLDKYRRRINKQGELVIHSQRYRDQDRNISDCFEKIKELLLDVATPPKQRKPTCPTRGSKERRIREKKSRSQIKQSRRPPPYE